jgi:hypothetical protein
MQYNTTKSDQTQELRGILTTNPNSHRRSIKETPEHLSFVSIQVNPARLLPNPIPTSPSVHKIYSSTTTLFIILSNTLV